MLVFAGGRISLVSTTLDCGCSFCKKTLSTLLVSLR